MQDQKNSIGIEQIFEGAGPGQLPAQLVKEIMAAEALLMVSLNEQGTLVIRPTVPGREFNPQHDPVHAFVQQVITEHHNLVAGMQGKITDTLRYRALRDFAVMAQADKPRFEKINAMLQKFEEGGAVPAESARTAADHDKFAEFLALAIQETEPDLVAPTVAAERDGTPQIILPGAPRIAH
jgi:hypothetical protein